MGAEAALVAGIDPDAGAGDTSPTKDVTALIVPALRRSVRTAAARGGHRLGRTQHLIRTRRLTAFGVGRDHGPILEIAGELLRLNNAIAHGRRYYEVEANGRGHDNWLSNGGEQNHGSEKNLHNLLLSI
jgi:hypothetical protein